MFASLMKVVGESMEPILRDGQYVLVSSIPFVWSQPKVGDIVVARPPTRRAGNPWEKREIIKRIGEVNHNKYYLKSDNPMGLDSRSFGPVKRSLILAKVVLF